MAMDVNPEKALMTISAGSYATSNSNSNSNNNTSTSNYTNNNNNNSNSNSNSNNTCVLSPPTGCCGILGRLFCISRHSKTANVDNTPLAATLGPPSYVAVNAGHQQQQRRTQTTRSRRTPQEVYFESRGKSCKKLLKFNGSSNKILLYPEEGWARTASSSYWTITPCWWQPNRCRIEEFSGTQRQTTRAKMLPLEQKGSLLVAGHFRGNSSSSRTVKKSNSNSAANGRDKDTVLDEFKLYLTSNISMEDYNMGYCLTGFVERRCQQTNAFQMTHFAVIKRQWPSTHNRSDSKYST